jgi:hypothetical protein
VRTTLPPRRDEFGYDAILATMDGAPQQADELGTSQLTQSPPVLTLPSQLAAGGVTPAGGRATPSPDQLGGVFLLKFKSCGT